MYGTPAMPKDLNLPFVLTPYKQGKEEGELQQQQGMLRYRSSSGAVLGDVCEELLPRRTSSMETEPMFGRFPAAADPRDYLGEKHDSGGAPEAPHMFFQWHQPPQQEHDQSHHNPQQQQLLPSLGNGGGGSSSLLRQGSSPAGLFSSLNVENGFPGGRGLASGGLNFGSRQGSLMSQISEIGPESMAAAAAGSPDDGGGGGRRFLSGYPVASWDDSVVLSDSFSKRIRDPSEVQQQNGELRSHHHLPSLTSHHLSLPKSSAEMAVMERFIQLQDAVPCKVRAKRGCATHPRSIAERVRRTRISERIKKLQELVPNMDKQTNTADMLDLAVDYIKDLQRQAKVLSDSRSNCTCTSRHKP